MFVRFFLPNPGCEFINRLNDASSESLSTNVAFQLKMFFFNIINKVCKKFLKLKKTHLHIGKEIHPYFKLQTFI